MSIQAAQRISIKKERETHRRYGITFRKLKEYDIQAVIQVELHFIPFSKMDRRNVDYDQLTTPIGYRILVDNITEVYKALGVIHADLNRSPDDSRTTSPYRSPAVTNHFTLP